MQAATRQGSGADLNIWVTMLNNGGVVGCGMLICYALKLQGKLALTPVL